MKKINDLRQIQLLLCDMLSATLAYFKDNNINYILCGGSLLGTVRHGGFIPWDDDIDLLVPRSDYDKLILILKNNNCLLGDIYGLVPSDFLNICPYIKIINKKYKIVDKIDNSVVDKFLYIDVFPMDHFPDNNILHRFFLFLIKLLRVISYSNVINNNSFKHNRFVFLLSKILYVILGKYNRINIMIDNLARKMNNMFTNSYHVGDGAWPHSMKDYFAIDAVYPTMIKKFEGINVCVPVNYDLYLKTFYGDDYMQLPPLEKRITHELVVYDITV